MEPRTADIVAPMKQVMLFALISAAFSLLGLAVASYNRSVPWTALLAGVVVACAGFQIANARRLFARIAPAAVRTWMIPTSWALYLTGAVLSLIGVRALLQRVG